LLDLWSRSEEGTPGGGGGRALGSRGRRGGGGEALTFVADVDEHAVFAPSGRRLVGGWAPFVARLRDRGIPLDRLRDGEVPIRNARGEITVRRRRIEGV